MDNPPPSYNPNDSMLSGGLDAPIMKVMGGGGAPPGYNETVSMLDGGTEPIVMVKGGAIGGQSLSQKREVEESQKRERVRAEKERKGRKEGKKIKQERERQRERDEFPENIGNLGKTFTNQGKEDAFVKKKVTTAEKDKKWEDRGKRQKRQKQKEETEENVGNLGSLFKNQGKEDAFVKEEAEHSINVRFVEQFPQIDDAQKQTFLGKIVNLKDVNARLQRQIDAKPEVNLEYIKNNVGSYDATIIASDKNYVKIKYIPINVDEIIVLPPITTVEDFLQKMVFLTNNKYISINDKNQLIIKKKLFIVQLPSEALKTSDQLQYLYLRLKVTNINKYYIADTPYKLIYPQKMNNQILYISNEDLKKPAINHLEPVDFNAISDTHIKQMAYPTSGHIYEGGFLEGGFLQVKEGTDSKDMTNPIMLSKNIAIFEVKESDFNTIMFDINGMNYRIRVPDGKNDIVYNSWLNKKYTSSETQLFKDLDIDTIPELENPVKKAEMLFELSYFKCFNDVSLLTKEECSSLRHTLQMLYKNKLKNDSFDFENEGHHGHHGKAHHGHHGKGHHGHHGKTHGHHQI